MIFGQIKIWLWIVLFIITILYEILYVKYILAISKLQSLKTAGISLMLTTAGMISVILYTGEANNCIPILVATGISNYYIIELEKKKRAKEDQKTNKK